MEQNQNSIEKEISLLFEAVNCFEKVTTIEVKAGPHRTISLSLCNICVNKFVGDDWQTLPKEDPKSITAINQPQHLDEYKYKSYEELSQEFQEVYLAAARAFVLIPQMYNRLTLVDDLPHKDAIAKIQNDHDHLRGFTERNIRRYLPANNPNIPRRVRTSRPKNSVTETSVGTFFSDTKHNDERNIDHKIGGESISNHVGYTKQYYRYSGILMQTKTMLLVVASWELLDNNNANSSLQLVCVTAHLPTINLGKAA